MYRIFHVIDTVVFWFFLFLGVYLIYVGEVIQKFQLTRANFAEYEEEIAEFPTLLTYIQYDLGSISSNWTYLEYGKDFNFRFRIGKGNMKALAIGENSFEGSSIKVDLKEQIEFSKDMDKWMSRSPETRQVNSWKDIAV